MIFSEQLLHHAVELIADGGANPEAQEARNRRAVSACYYALFHRITQDAAELLGPHMAPELRSRIARWLEHAEIRRVCGYFTKPVLERPLGDLIGESAPAKLQLVAKSFIDFRTRGVERITT